MADDPDALRQRVGMVFQHFNLFPHKTVLHNITLALRRLKRHARDEADAPRLAPAGPGRPAAQGRRAAGARSPAASSSGSPSPGRWPWSREVMLFDEATSALDPELVKGVLD